MHLQIFDIVAIGHGEDGLVPNGGARATLGILRHPFDTSRLAEMVEGLCRQRRPQALA